MQESYTFEKVAPYSVYKKACRQSDHALFMELTLKKHAFDGLQQSAQILMQSIRHPSLLCLCEVIADEGGFVKLIFEDFDHKLPTLDEIIDKGLDEDKARFITRQIADALCCLHSQGVLFRALKLENILVINADLNIKLINFHNNWEDSATSDGLPYYLAPELWRCLEETAASDIWSLGVILYAMLTGVFPFPADNLPSLASLVLEGICNFGLVAKVSAGAADLLRKILVVDPSTRITAEQVLLHPWIQGPGPKIALKQEANFGPSETETSASLLPILNDELDPLS